jgi:hypothetical protein
MGVIDRHIALDTRMPISEAMELTVVPRQLFSSWHVLVREEGHVVVIVVRALNFHGEEDEVGVFTVVVDEPAKKKGRKTQ